MPETSLTGGDDLFSAPGAQADIIFGLGGNDTILGNDADDSILGGDGNDLLDGGSQNDTLRGEAGDDTLVSSSGNNLLDGGTGDDSILGGPQEETLLGGDGNDTIIGAGAADLIEGGAGDDSLVAGNFGATTLIGGAGNDVLVANGDITIMFGGGGDDTFTALTGNYGDKYISGGGGADVAVFGGTYDPANWVVEQGTFQGLPYEAYYQIPFSYRVYFHQFEGDLIFDDGRFPVVVPCFAEGTMILTAAGERPVETLRAGDLVATASGRGAPFKPVRWIGRRRVDLAAHPRPASVAPVLVMPGALGEGTPHRPLRLSPDHAVRVGGALVPVGLLTDGRGIVQDIACRTVTNFHVELFAHDLLVSDGAVTESFVAAGNRQAFENAGTMAVLHADFAPAPGTAPAMPRCLPLVTEGLALEAARASLARRAAAMNPRGRLSAA
ncbi:Ca2+-binding RTX toxin-like protein [Roseomonas alkaliterrae]|uniref:Ca2+-binding RTX toxin-like protein n=2 Tax=Neoroseomonas alkaliterrae TaxID=1452450 RepID=A0A840Y5X6_9PROT|nr:Hint domain-containing protein [Neoroseomonas alkaliterrae]MBB5689284.1 Ca2+-binding RTX toxin-like protein [Neoroseomonas alkaliterrae]